MAFSWSNIFAEAESFINEATSVAGEVPAAVQTAANALDAAKAAVTTLESALKGVAPAPAAPAAS